MLEQKIVNKIHPSGKCEIFPIVNCNYKKINYFEN